MRRKSRTCPDGCQGSGETFASLTETEILHELDELVLFVEAPRVDAEAEERAWQASIERMHRNRDTDLHKSGVWPRVR